MQIINVSLAKA